MNKLLSSRLALLNTHPGVLNGIQRGIEKEGLRVDAQGLLSTASHPVALGSALTHPRITTDYSEALLELITGTHNRVDALMDEIDLIHRITVAGLGQEMIWNHSMPAHLPSEKDIPIARYGTSNTGTLKHVYRKGLAERYGKTMQCIAGLHYNFSFDETFWSMLDMPGKTEQEKRSAGYISLIRNFSRYSWLLMYLFGASPAVSRDFLRGRDAGLERLDEDTFYLPHATSLRMSDLGYQNKAQSSLKPCYNDLSTFLARLYEAVTTPWPDYEKIGTHRDGKWIQLNTNILQIENEYYSSIRPKRTTGPCERPITALAERGIQYIEVRCLDIDPFSRVGITAETARFVDAFLLFCALNDSPHFPGNGFCVESAENFATVVKHGRTPGLMLKRNGQEVSMQAYAQDLTEGISACASQLDASLGDSQYLRSVEVQLEKLNNPELTPSARLLDLLKSQHRSFHSIALQQSRDHDLSLRQSGLSTEESRTAYQDASRSLQEQLDIEQSDKISFEEYVRQFHGALKRPAMA